MTTNALLNIPPLIYKIIGVGVIISIIVGMIIVWVRKSDGEVT